MIVRMIYWLFSVIDNFIYGMASMGFRVIYDISQQRDKIFSSGDITRIANTIYVVVGVLMLFKLVVSAIQYLINPDMLDDKEKGAFGILKNILITVFLIIIMPAIFTLGRDLESGILKTIPSIILGSNAPESLEDDTIGGDLSFTVLASFITVRKDSGGSIGVGNYTIHDVPSFFAHIGDGCRLTMLGEIISPGCHYSYFFIISTAAGIYLCFMLASMALDVAVRSIKLAIIQILSPISISCYVFSKDKFNKFIKTYLTVYADLFIRFAVIYIVILVFQMLLNSDILNVLAIGGGGIADTGSWLRNVAVNIAIIFGLLNFAKKAPKFITDLLGLPDVGSGEIADMFKRAGGFAGTLVGTGRALYAARRNSFNELVKKSGINTNSDEWKALSSREKNRRLKAAVSSKDWNARNAKVFRSTGAALRNGLFQSVGHSKGFKDVMDSSKSAAEKSYAVSKALDDKGLTRSQYRQEVLNRRLGVESSFSQMSAEAESSRSISNAANASLDMAHNILGDKMPNAKLTNAYINQIRNINDNGSSYRALTSAFDIHIRDAKGNETFTITMDDLNADKGGKFTLSAIQTHLQEIVSDTTGKYDFNEKSYARGKLDEINGQIDAFIVGQEAILANGESTTSGAKLNPKLSNSIQKTRDEFAKFISTPFGKAMVEKGKEMGIINDKGEIIHGLEGVWEQLIKKEGINEETRINANMGKEELAGMAVKDIADRFDKKS